MNTPSICFVLVLGIIHPLPSLAQGDTLRIREGFAELPIHSYVQYFSANQEITADSAWKVFTERPLPREKLNKIHFGPVNGFYWLVLTVQNASVIPQDLFLQIRQPHIYRMIFYHVEDSSVPGLAPVISKLSETGIRYNFFQRPSPHRFFDFPFSCQPGESYTILMMVHHINSLSLPIYLASSEVVNSHNYNQNLVWGYWFGFLSFCAVFALVASLLLRKSVFLWYFLYILSAALYGFADQGFGFQFFFPSLANAAALMIIQLAVCNFVFLIKFSQGLLDTRKHLPTVHRILNSIFYLLLALLVLGVVFQEIMFRLSTIVLPIVNVVTIAGLVLLALSGIKSIFTNRIVAIFYLTAYLTLVTAGIFSTLTYGFGVFQYTGPNPILIAYFFEAMILSVALVVLFKQVQQERTRLMAQVNIQQKEMYQKYIEGIEKERSRIAGELHDDIGSRLSHLKREIQQSAEGASHQLDDIIQDVRLLSHDLAPPVAKVSGLMPLVEKLIMETRKSSGIDLKLQRFDYQERFSSYQIQQIYRVLQEAIHNIVEHAKANHADIQFFGYENEVVLTIEDDGQGFEPDKVQGLGLNQMKVRVESLGGKLEINSHPGTGCHLLIQIPFLSTS